MTIALPEGPEPGAVEPAAPTAGPGNGPGNGRRSRRSGHRSVLVLAGVAVVSLVAGLGLSKLIVNPAEAAARTAPPAAGPITVPVESRELSNDVVLRGDVVFDDAVDLTVETADIGERAIVTGQVPEAGATLDAGSVALEIAGRPVIVLPGGLPTYRSLRAGTSGPDVVQLKQALAALGIAAGDPASNVYDAATAAGVQALYQRVGYPAPSAGDTATEALTAAQDGVRAAQTDLTSAQQALSTASKGGASAADVAQADAAVRSAQRAVDVAVADQADLAAQCAATPCGQGELTAAQKAVDDAKDQVTVAQAQRAALDAPVDTAGARAAVTEAQTRLADAQKALSTAQAGVLTPLPAGEVVYLETLPRRVDDVKVERGGTVNGAVMSVSGATIVVNATATAADAALLEVGATGTIPLDDVDIPVTVTSIEAAKASDGDSGSSGRSAVTLTPGELTPEQVVALQGQNLRVTIPVSSTGGAVLAVPLAALTAGPGGESRVEVLGSDGATQLVEVKTGLAAGGYVEVTGVGHTLSEGDLVVVGTAGSEAADEGDGAKDGDGTKDGEQADEDES